MAGVEKHTKCLLVRRRSANDSAPHTVTVRQMFSVGPAKRAAGSALHFGSGPFPHPEFLPRKRWVLLYAAPLPLSRSKDRRRFEIVGEKILLRPGDVKAKFCLSAERAKKKTALRKILCKTKANFLQKLSTGKIQKNVLDKQKRMCYHHTHKTQGRRVVGGDALSEKCRLVRGTKFAEPLNWLQSGRAEGK